MRVPFVDPRPQHHALRREIRSGIGRVLAHNRFILGPEVHAFEEAFARLVRVPHAVGVSSGLDALRLSLLALDIGRGDEVIVPANTYIATAFAVTSVDAKLVFVDCRPDTYNVDVGRVERAMTRRTRAVIPVHLAGQPAEMGPLLEIARRRGISVIEDACQAHGAAYRGHPCGSLGKLGCFSFYPSKNLGACGDGGMVTTQDRRMAERIRRLRNYGQRAKNLHVEYGQNARLDTLQAAILLAKLPHLRGWNARRSRHARLYRKLLEGVGDLSFQQGLPATTAVHHLFVVETGRRDALQRRLEACGVETGIHYPIPIHLQKAYRSLGYRKGDFPCAERLAGRSLSLPMFPELSERQVSYVASCIRQFFGKRPAA